MRKKAFPIVVFALYMLMLVWLVVFKLALPGEALESIRRLILVPYLRSSAVSRSAVISEVIWNILAFIPLGLYLSLFGVPKKAWLRVVIGFAVSFVFEAIQYIFAIGTSDVTDLINNTLGTLIGVLAWPLIQKLFRDRAEKVTNIVFFILLMTALAGYVFLSAVNV